MISSYLLMVGAAVGTYAAAGQLLLDADVQDMTLEWRMTPSSKLHQPEPGDVFAFDNDAMKWEPTSVCPLHAEDAPKVTTPDTLRAENSWGLALNNALSSLDSVIDKPVFSNVAIKNAKQSWSFTKEFRESMEGVQFRAECLAEAVVLSQSPHWTVFVVDSVFEPTEEGMSAFVMFKSTPVQPGDCAPECPGNVSLDEIVRGGPIARFKTNWEMLAFH